MTTLRDKLSKLAQNISVWREWWRESQIPRIETLLLLSLLIPAFIASAGFFFGRVVSGSYFIIGLAVSFLGALFVSWKQALRFVAVAAGFLLLTAFTFSYTSDDALGYHCPMQLLLIDGWNPVFQSSVERFTEYYPDGGFRFVHTLFLPKFSALCGALVAKTTGFFVGDAFLAYALVLALWRTAKRYACLQWNCSLVASHIFAVGLAFSTIMIGFFTGGGCDYVLYAALLCGALGCLAWVKTREIGDLVLAGMGLAVAMLAKTTGFVYAGLIIVLVAFLCRFTAHYRWALLVLSVFVLVVGASPLLTNWIQYGGPFYPTMTFDPTVEPIDIASDLVENADGASMGYLSRIVYAWFSEGLAIKGCALWNGNPDFAPELYGAMSRSGFGGLFKFLMWGSVLALCLSRKNVVFWLCLFLFFTSNLAPLKFIGYARYFPQIWAIPFLAIFNFLYAPLPFVARASRYAKPVLLVGCLLLVIPGLAKSLAWTGRKLYDERVREDVFSQLCATSTNWRLEVKDSHSYSFIKRAEAAGLACGYESDEGVPVLRYDYDRLMPLPDGDESVHERVEAFSICNPHKSHSDIKSIMKFLWFELVCNLPHPLMR